MKRKNRFLLDFKALNPGIDWRGYTRMVQTQAQSQRMSQPASPAATKSKTMKYSGNRDIPAFNPGGGTGCIAHRRAKSFARAMGRRMVCGR